MDISTDLTKENQRASTIAVGATKKYIVPCESFGNDTLRHSWLLVGITKNITKHQVKKFSWTQADKKNKA